ncbi:MAG: polysaccharide biosynthesis C-terminal domain-containing protein [Clostridia bacterium]|nr:polysaccharide biosynthesis C-terminal domain-containing protein [Clostridia bacterium]
MEANNLLQNYKRTNKTLIKKYLEFFFSMLLSVVFLQFTTVADTIIVGKLLGTAPMSGIKVAMPIINILVVLGTLIGVGSGTITSIMLGQRKNKEASASFTISIIFSIVAGIVVAAIFVPLANQIGSLIASNEEISGFTATYIRIVMAGGFFFILASVLGMMLRSDGFAKLSMFVLITGGGMNVVFDLIFMKVLNMGVDGSAYATILGMFLACLVGTLYFFSKNHSLRFINIFKKENKPLVKQLLKPIFKTGISSSLRVLFTNAALLVLNYLIGKRIGVFGIAILTVCSNIQLILSSIFTAGGQAMTPLCGVLYGEKDSTGIKLLLQFVFIFVMAIVIVLTIVAEIISPQLFSLFSVADPDGLGAFYLRIYLIGIIPIAINYMMIYYYSTIQKQKIALVMTFCENIIFYLPLGIGLLYPLNMLGVTIAFVVSEALSIAVMVLFAKLDSKKHNLTSVLLLPKENTDLLYEASILADSTNLVKISEEIQNILKSKNIDESNAYKTALAIEEMLNNTINLERNKKRKNIAFDVLVYSSGKTVTISLRDNGIANNPTLDGNNVEEENRFDSIVVLNKIAKNIKYNRVIELNHTIIEL